MESQPQNPEFRNDPENFHPCVIKGLNCAYLSVISAACSGGLITVGGAPDSSRLIPPNRSPRTDSLLMLISE